MPNTMTQFGFVKKSGDVMTGDLALGVNKLTMLYDSVGGAIKGSGVIPGGIKVIDTLITGDGVIEAGGCLFSDDLGMGAGKTVDGVDVSEIHQAKIKTGTYVGNGVDNRNIDIGVDLASKSNAYVIIKKANTNAACHRIEYAQGDLTMTYDASADAANLIQAFTATGFQVGTAATVNEDTFTYRYIAIWSE